MGYLIESESRNVWLRNTDGNPDALPGQADPEQKRWHGRESCCGCGGEDVIDNGTTDACWQPGRQQAIESSFQLAGFDFGRHALRGVAGERRHLGAAEHIALPADRLLQITYPERGPALEFENESLAYIGFRSSADHPQRRLPVDNLHDEMQFFGDNRTR